MNHELMPAFGQPNWYSELDQSRIAIGKPGGIRFLAFGESEAGRPSIYRLQPSATPVLPRISARARELRVLVLQVTSP